MFETPSETIHFFSGAVGAMTITMVVLLLLVRRWFKGGN